MTDGPEGFDEFFRATWPRLFRTAYAVAGDAGSAEDALQAAYARAFARWGHVSSTDHPEAYVRRMVVNEILGTRRGGWWKRERPQADTEPPGSHDGPELGLVERDAVWSAVLGLPVRQRAVVVLRYYEDLSEEQIADVLGCSRGTVKSQASAALTNLRRSADALQGDQ
ncbi:SigE family RNA polymerase sigma factor [Nocardioides sp. T2.26MG-1]|uniref:SigE family RNA polymerase sigma factor n=1 Tax=Nocardioides sp. T2.26MG-1 TaxID=3041166 RepID=UPI002477C395|nr:SigE family RNA polymerase sigma factor [Nocardioides sp. T2.26MG-1]CAI9409328.1 RNA polymerase sigma-E factor [Nocardioides sp. T2.26MG-1]